MVAKNRPRAIPSMRIAPPIDTEVMRAVSSHAGTLEASDAYIRSNPATPVCALCSNAPCFGGLTAPTAPPPRFLFVDLPRLDPPTLQPGAHVRNRGAPLSPFMSATSVPPLPPSTWDCSPDTPACETSSRSGGNLLRLSRFSCDEAHFAPSCARCGGLVRNAGPPPPPSFSAPRSSSCAIWGNLFFDWKTHPFHRCEYARI